LGDGATGLERSSPTLSKAAAAQVAAWQGHVLDLVRAEGADKRAISRAVSLGVNAVGAALMVVVFAHTGGLSGGEIMIAGGTATLSQKVLEAIFGDQAVRTLAAQARVDLMHGLDDVIGDEQQRYLDLLHAASPPPDAAIDLRAAVQRLKEARR
jgi:hypothetical protein